MTTVSKTTLAVACLLYVFSFGLRYWKFSKISPFVDDHARDAITVMEHLEQRKPFILGPKASVGNFYVQPFYYYFISVPMFLSNGNPDTASFAVILVESFTPVLLYLLGKRYWSELSGQIMGVLYAVSPFAITFASFAWSPNLIPFFAAVMLLTSFEYLIRGRKNMIILSIVSGVLAFQMHYQSFILLMYLGLLGVYAVFFSKKSVRPWLVGAGAGALTLLPLLFDVNITLENFRNITAFFTQEHARFYQTVRTLPFFWNFIPQVYEHALGLASDGFLYGRIIFLATYSFFGIAGLIEFLRIKKIGKTALLFFFITTALVGLRVYKGDKLEYYLLFMIYIPAVSIGILVGRVRGVLRHIFLGVIAVVLFQLGRTTPGTTQLLSRDYETFTKAVGSIDEHYGSSYYLAGVPYVFFENTFKYVWKHTYRKTPWTEDRKGEMRHVYICKPEQQCSDLFCSVHAEDNEYVNERIAREEAGNGYVYSDQYGYDIQGRRFQVVMYEKQ